MIREAQFHGQDPWTQQVIGYRMAMEDVLAILDGAAAPTVLPGPERRVNGEYVRARLPWWCPSWLYRELPWWLARRVPRRIAGVKCPYCGGPMVVDDVHALFGDVVDARLPHGLMSPWILRLLFCESCDRGVYLEEDEFQASQLCKPEHARLVNEPGLRIAKQYTPTEREAAVFKP